MNSKDGIILWTLGAAGVFFLVSAVKNITPQSLLLHYLGNGDLVPIQAAVALPETTTGKPNSGSSLGGSTGNGFSGGGGGGGGGGGRGADTSSPGDVWGFGAGYNSQGQYIADLPTGYAESPNTHLPARAVTQNV